eukprot:NODE_150_length_15491_cov_0.365644.p2 type:complete len:665 gc:universal NODE_150_length_15491_cov_0.365644:1660-3654(+)
MIAVFLLLHSKSMQLTDDTQFSVSTNFSFPAYFVGQISYKIEHRDLDIQKEVANGMWFGSPLRRMLLGMQHRNTTSPSLPILIKRDGGGAMAGISMALGMSGPSYVGMVRAFTTDNLTPQERANIFMGSFFDITSTVLMFSGNPIGIAMGSVMMISKSFFDSFDAPKSPPQIDADVMFKQIQDYIQHIVPSADQMYIEIKPYVQDLVENSIDLALQQQYIEKQQIALRKFSEYLSIFDSETEPEKILHNWETLVQESASEMLNSKLPLHVDDTISFEIFEIATAVAVYPQFVSMLIMSVKEWYITAAFLKKDTSQIEKKFTDYISGFRKQYELMVNAWYDQSKAHIQTSHFERANSNQCKFTLMIPSSRNIEGYFQETAAAPNYIFNPSAATEFQAIREENCVDQACRFVTQLDELGANVCEYEKTYTENCSKPCSAAKQAVSWIFPILGATDSQCFLNKEQCKEMLNGIKVRNEASCKPSNCTIQMNAAKDKLLADLEAKVSQTRKSVLKYNALLDGADIKDQSNFLDAITDMKSTALQKYLPKDEVFNGSVCQGLLAFPKDRSIPKLCIVSTKTRYSCPTIYNGKKQYILYPDVIKAELPQLCPKYLRPKKDVITKLKIMQTIGSGVTDEEFIQIKLAKENMKNIKRIDGVEPRHLKLSEEL